MYFVKAAVEVEEVIKKSRFIGVLFPCQTKQEAIHHLGQQALVHLNASHIAFAYRIKTPITMETRFYDAGEPSGTAGKPIFQHLEGKQLINLLCVVIRYYGGIKLGTGGLTRAYGNTAKKAIEASKVCEYIEYAELKIALDYPQMQSFEYHLAKLEGRLVDKIFSESIALVVSLPEKNVQTLLGLFKQ
ncbi:MAG: YigZ family protein [Methylococcales bacterium]|nr:YigZ family protein [Methylococcales bacterium]